MAPLDVDASGAAAVNELIVDTFNMNIPGPILPGLEMMIGLDHMIIKQVIDMLEVFIEMDFSNYYEVFDPRGMRLYVIGERTGCCVRLCMKTTRPFQFDVSTAFGQPVLTIKRTCSCCLVMCNGFCCNEVTVIHTLSGKVLGRISQVFCACSPTFNVYNESGGFVAKIVGPFCGAACPECVCCSASFNIYLPGVGPSIGCVRKVMGGLCTECCTVADTYEVTMDPNMDLELKATIMGVAMAVDFTYFESPSNNCGKGPFWEILFLLIVVAVIVVIVVVVLSRKSEKDSGPN